jgi:cysteine dioxygenase
MLASWRGDEACAPHDHGASRGLVCVLEGSFRETLYRMQSGVFTTLSQRDHATHALINVERDVIHAMEPRGPGVTLHVYAPAISCMRVFDCERHEALTVSDDCGAWIPRDVRMVNARSCMSALAR